MKLKKLVNDRLCVLADGRAIPANRNRRVQEGVQRHSREDPWEVVGPIPAQNKVLAIIVHEKLTVQV
jgi:hypothetical protein